MPVPPIKRSTRWWQLSAAAQPAPLDGDYVGAWNADDRSLETRPGDCGRNYLLKAAVLVEVTFCGFPESVPALVITNIAANVPG